MKHLQQAVHQLLKDRLVLILMGLYVVLLIIFTVIAVLLLKPSEIQIPIRYSGYTDSLVNDYWYERISFIVFAWLQAVTCYLLVVSLMRKNYRLVARYVLSFGLFSLLLTAIILIALTRTITL
jgi:hypothetical protein